MQCLLNLALRSSALLCSVSLIDSNSENKCEDILGSSLFKPRYTENINYHGNKNLEKYFHVSQKYLKSEVKSNWA